MILEYAVNAVTIRNIYENVNKVHSSVFVVVGLINEAIPAQDIFDYEIAECLLLDTVPVNCTFEQTYVNELIQYAISRFSVKKNLEMWNKASQSYDDQTTISESDIHYGPLIPGESELQLLSNLSGKYILDLGCGAGYNLIAAKNLGAKGGRGIDFCENQIKRAKEKINLPFSLIVGEIADKSLIEKEKFDIVISIFSISFIESLDNFFYIIEQNLKPGGSVVISTDHPNRKLSDNFIIKEGKKCNQSRLRYWNIPNEKSIPYVHYLHSYSELNSAIQKAGLIVDKVIVPKVLPLEKIEKAPYRSLYYINRYQEMLKEPYTIIFKAYKPLTEIYKNK